MHEQFSQPPHRKPQLSAHNWHSWSVPPSARVPFEPSDSGEQRLTPALLQESTAAEAIVGLLCELGMNTFFGIPGGPVIPVFDAILTNENAQLIESRHEAYAAFSAIGFHRASGKVPVVVVTAGPGATNVVTGVASAHLERVPMLVICGDVPWASTGHKMFQDSGEAGVGIERMMRGLARAVVRVSKASSASSQVLSAVRAATDPTHPGPAVIIISIDSAGSRATPPEIYTPSLEQAPPPAAPDPELLQRTADLLRGARRPLLLVGGGCRGEPRRLRELVDVLGVPFVTSLQAKGLIPEDHPLSLRTCGAGASLWARKYMNSGVDVILVLGSDLDDMTTTGTPVGGNQGALIHVDTDPSVFARNVQTSIAANYDVGAFADGLIQVARRWDKPYRGMALLEEIRAISPFDIAEFAADYAMPIAPHRALADLERACGPNTTFVTDIGEHTLFGLHYLTIREGQRFVVHLGLGSMGSGISSAVGLALGDPSRRIVCICGDGGMQMAGMELLVATKLRLPIVYAVFNDARYNMVYHGYRLTFNRDAAWETPMVNFAQWAEALGARGHLVARPGEITTDLLDTLTSQGYPVVLDIRHDAAVRIRNSGRVESVRDMMTK